MEGKKEIKEASEGTQVIQTLWCYCVQQSEQRLGDQRDHQNNHSYPLCRASESEEQSLLGPTETWATLMFMHWYKKKPDKGVQCQTFTRTGSGPPNLPIKVHSKYRNMNSIKLHEQRKRCLHRHTLKYWQQTENNYRTGECSGHTRVRVPVNLGAWSQPPFNGNVFLNINKTTNCSVWNIQDVYDVSVSATELNVYSWEPVVTPQRRLWLGRRCYSPSPQA